MSDRAFKAMQAAVDIVNTSPHPTHKISSAVFNDDFLVTATNYWPKAIEDTIGKDKRVGHSSGTVHAETAAILKAPMTYGASICITDPFCPNCAKNIVEAGIKNVYIDHKGFSKTFWEMNDDHFKNMAMEIMAKAGVNVYELNRDTQDINQIYKSPDKYTPPEDSPTHIDPCPDSKEAFKALIHDMEQVYYNRKFVTGMVTTEDGGSFCITSRVHAVLGYSIENDHDIEAIANPGQKYSYIQEPVNRLIMAAKSKGYILHPEHIFCSQIPTSREMINMVGAGIKHMVIGNPMRAKRTEDIQAKNLLEENGIITFEEFIY